MKVKLNSISEKELFNRYVNTRLTMFFHVFLLNSQLIYKTGLFTMAQQPLVRQDLLIIKDSRSHSVRQTTVGRTPLHEWSVRCRELYLTTHKTHKRQVFMSPVGYEPAIPASERSQPDDLDRAASGIGTGRYLLPE